MLKCRKVEVEFIITIFPQHIPALQLLRAVSPSVVCAGWSLLKISDNQERSRRARPGFRIVINSNWFLFQPPEPSSVSHHSHCSLHPRSFLTTWFQFRVRSFVYISRPYAPISATINTCLKVLECSCVRYLNPTNVSVTVLWPKSQGTSLHASTHPCGSCWGPVFTAWGHVG